MPFAWTAVFLSSIVQGAAPSSSQSEIDATSSSGTSISYMGSQSSKSGSLDRTLNPMELLRKGKQMMTNTMSSVEQVFFPSSYHFLKLGIG